MVPKVLPKIENNKFLKEEEVVEFEEKTLLGTVNLKKFAALNKTRSDQFTNRTKRIKQKTLWTRPNISDQHSASPRGITRNKFDDPALSVTYESLETDKSRKQAANIFPPSSTLTAYSRFAPKELHFFPVREPKSPIKIFNDYKD